MFKNAYNLHTLTHIAFTNGHCIMHICAFWFVVKSDMVSWKGRSRWMQWSLQCWIQPPCTYMCDHALHTCEWTLHFIDVYCIHWCRRHTIKCYNVYKVRNTPALLSTPCHLSEIQQAFSFPFSYLETYALRIASRWYVISCSIALAHMYSKF